MQYKRARLCKIAQYHHELVRNSKYEDFHVSWVHSLGQEDPLEKGMATLSSILAWEIPWTEEPGGLQSMGWQRVGHDLVTKQQFSGIDLAEEMKHYYLFMN